METNLRVTAEILYISRSIDNMQLNGTCLTQQNLLNNKLNSLTISIHSPTALTVCDFCKYYYISIWEAVADFSSCINVQGNQTPKYCPFTTLMSRERGTHAQFSIGSYVCFSVALWPVKLNPFYFHYDK